MTVVVDASVVVAALIDTGPNGTWAEAVLGDGPLVAPHLLPAEVANILRRMSGSGKITSDVAALAHEDMLALTITMFPYEHVASRVWSLRSNVTAYDAWYVALAESLDAPLATLDRRLVNAPTLRCAFLTP